ncbi:MBL fold metallo-hydrolase [Singulisphaera sp. PoT]|uniref:MBL fold metallo-hydrolase n=1 Tax=Singulisphaera sp. PoT TaxID=3411797 RepID=UPI003BF6185A
MIATTRSRRLLFLGTGTSTGVPVFGCDCAVCSSTDPRNSRTRPSVLLQFPQGNLLIDTTPEMRIQLLRERIKLVHAIAYTHNHADHLFGLDDARLFPKFLGGPVPIYCEPETEATIRSVFHYAFNELGMNLPPGHLPKLRFESIAPAVPFEVLGERILPIRLEHGRFNVVGFRIGDLAYCTDVRKIPDASWPLLEGLDTLILDALRFEPHPTHFNLEQALEVVERLKPRRTFFTHLSHSFDHGPTESTLPPQVALAYDGLALEF